MKKRNTVAKEITTKKHDFKLTSELVREGKKLLTSLDHSITNQKEIAEKGKTQTISYANQLITYLSKFGTISTVDQIETIKNVLYDQLNWRRLGAEVGENKGRIKGNPTITKYFSIIKGYIEENGKLNTSLDFSDIRTAYQNRGSRTLKREFKYNLNKALKPISESIDSKKDSNLHFKNLKALIDSYCKEHNINQEI